MTADPGDRDEWDLHWSALDSVTELNPAQHYRHQLLVKLILGKVRARPAVRVVVDFGSGQGDFLRMLVPQMSGREIYGLELSRVGVEMSRSRVPGAHFLQHNMLLDEPGIAELKGRGELCTCTEVVEHLDEPAIFLANLRSYVAQGGTLIVTVPGGKMNAFERSIGHRQHFTSAAITALVRGAGFEVDKVMQAGFPFFNLYKILGAMRGDKVRADAENMGNGKPAGLLKWALLTFSVLFKFNLDNTPFGWQLIVIARNPA